MFTQDQEVMIRRLGENTPGEFRGIVKGIVAKFPSGNIYIIELIDNIPGNNWTHVSMTGSCIDPI